MNTKLAFPCRRLARRLPIVATALLLALAASSPLHAQSGPRLDDGFVSAEIRGIAQQDLYVKIDSVGHVFVPFGAFLEFLRADLAVSPDQSEYTAAFGTGRTFTIIPATGEARIMGQSVSFDDGLMAVRDDELWVRDSIMSICVGVGITYNPERVRLDVEPSNVLPVVDLRRTKESWWALGRAKNMEATTQIDASAANRSQFLGWPTIHWALRNDYVPKGDGGRFVYGGVAGAEIAFPLLWGRFTFNAQSAFTGANDEFRSSVGGWRWDYSIADFSPVRLFSLYEAGNAGVGIFLSNARGAAMRREGERHIVEGVTNPGYYVELYRGGELFNVKRADSVTGEYDFWYYRPMGYEDLMIVSIGPNGQRDTTYDRVGMMSSAIYPGTVQYNLVAAIDSFSSTTPLTGALDVGLGVTSWFSLRTELSPSFRSIQSVGRGPWYDSLRPRYTAELFPSQFTTAAVSYDQAYNYFGGRVGMSFGYFPLSIVASGIRASDSATFYDMAISASTGFNLMVGEQGFGLGLGAGYYGGMINSYPTLTWSNQLVSLALATNLTYVTDAERAAAALYNREEPKKGDLSFSTSDASLTVTPWELARFWFRARYNHEYEKISELQGQTRVHIDRGIAATLTYSIPYMDFDRSALYLGLSYSTDWFRSRSRSGVAPDGYIGTTSNMDGAISISEIGPRFGRPDMFTRGNVVLRAFNDRNGNGLLDDGEERLSNPLGSMRLEGSDNGMITSDENGLFDRLPVDQDMILEIDPWSLAADEFYPVQRIYSVYVSASEMKVIDVPFRSGYVVEGECRIERPSRSGAMVMTTQGINALRIWLEPVGAGTTIDGEIFDDGTIFVQGVPEGEYRISFDPAQLKYRRITPKELPTTVRIAAGETTLPLIILTTIPDESATPSSEGR